MTLRLMSCLPLLMLFVGCNGFGYTCKCGRPEVGIGVQVGGLGCTCDEAKADAAAICEDESAGLGFLFDCKPDCIKAPAGKDCPKATSVSLKNLLPQPDSQFAKAE